MAATEKEQESYAERLCIDLKHDGVMGSGPLVYKLHSAPTLNRGTTSKVRERLGRETAAVRALHALPCGIEGAVLIGLSTGSTYIWWLPSCAYV
jgi:hypothetical protein